MYLTILIFCLTRRRGFGAAAGAACLQNFVKFQKIQLENLVDFEKCCKTHIFLQKSEPIQPKTSNILPKFCQPTLSDVSASELLDATRRLLDAMLTGDPGIERHLLRVHFERRPPASLPAAVRMHFSLRRCILHFESALSLRIALEFSLQTVRKEMLQNDNHYDF